MASLPTPGADTDTWGSELNAFLSVAHNPDGTLEFLYNVQEYGATLDGSTDDSAAIQAAIDAAYTAGGGVVVIPGKDDSVVVDSPLELQTGVWLRGLGSCTSLAGTADPMIRIKQDAVHDRLTVTDLFLQDPDGIGIELETNGDLQLGWPRITIENVTVSDATSYAFRINPSGVIECRFLNCVSLRSGADGFSIHETDNMLVACTAAESTGHGFDIAGGNNKVTACKAYGNDLSGFNIGGSGRHVFAGCEAQDNVLAGFAVNGTWNTLAGCLADTNGTAGVEVLGSSNSVDGSFMFGGGGSGQQTKSGVFFGVDATANVVSGVTNALTPVAGKAEENSVHVNALAGSRKQIAYTATWTPDPYDADTQAMTLTGDLTLMNPVYKHVGQQLTLELRQDGSGSHTVTFPDQFRVDWTPVTTADALNIIGFEYDGTAWQQKSSVAGLTPKPSIGLGDTFNRANEVLNVSSSGATWEKYNSGSGVWNVVSNQAVALGSGSSQTNLAVLNAGVPDFTAQVTVVTQSVSAGMVWRYTDNTNYYVIGVNNISKLVAGVQTSITSGTFNIATGDVVKIVASGPNHFLYINGTLVTTFSDTSHLSATKVGMSAAAATDVFDAFTIA